VYFSVVLKTCRDELNTARKEKNETERRYVDNLKEIETVKKEVVEVKEFCEVGLILTFLLFIA